MNPVSFCLLNDESCQCNNGRQTRLTCHHVHAMKWISIQITCTLLQILYILVVVVGLFLDFFRSNGPFAVFSGQFMMLHIFIAAFRRRMTFLRKIFSSFWWICIVLVHIGCYNGCRGCWIKSTMGINRYGGLNIVVVRGKAAVGRVQGRSYTGLQFSILLKGLFCLDGAIPPTCSLAVVSST